QDSPGAVSRGVDRGLDGELREDARCERERLAGGDAGVVAPPHPELPLVGELVERATVDPPDGILERRILPQIAVQLADAPLAGGESEEAWDHAAHRIDDPAGGVGELALRRQPAPAPEV